MVVKSVDGTHLPTGCGAPAAYLPAASALERGLS